MRPAVNDLEKHHVRWVLWFPDGPSYRSNPPLGDALEPLRAYVRTKYRQTQIFFGESISVWERKD